jgi:ankyrin repeat protein
MASTNEGMSPDYDEACTSASDFEELDIKQAAQFGDLSKVRHLIESGLASVNDTDSDDCSLLHWAAINNRHDVVKYLIDNKCDINHIGGVLRCTPLHWACRQGLTRMVALLVKNGANYNVMDGEGFTVLHTACQYGRTPIACYLIAKGQSPDIRDASQMTPLMYAAARSVGHDPMHMLVSMGADINASDGIFGHTPLHFAVIHGNHSGISTLLKLGANPSILNKENETPLDIAQRKNDYLSMRLLESGERQAGLRRFTWKQRLYEDQNIRSQIAFILPFFFYFIPGFIFNSKIDIIIKTLFVTAAYGICAFLIKHFIGSHVPSVSSFTFGFVVASKMFYFIIWLMYLHQTAGWYLQIFFFVILVLLPYLYYILYSRDPGILTYSHGEQCRQIIEMTEGDNFEGNFCSTCLLIRPIRSKHCRYCDKCVRRFDHHCIWINKCIGYENHRLFISYLVLLQVSAFVMITGCLLYINDFCGGIFLHNLACQPWVSYTLIMAINLFFWLSLLSFMQFYGIAQGLTANERINAHRYKHLNSGKFARNIFSQGCFHNLYNFFFEDDSIIAKYTPNKKTPIV